MGRRTDLWTIKPADRQALAADILRAAQPIAHDHRLIGVQHTYGIPFFWWHRQYLEKLEALISGKKPGKLLPKWDPYPKKLPPNIRAYTIPDEFLVPTSPQADAIHSPPPLPFDIFARYRGENLRQFDHPDRLANELQDLSHTYIHAACGGIMSNPNRTAEAPIFWCWHGFIDDIWEDWLSMHIVGHTEVPVPHLLFMHMDDGDAQHVTDTLGAVGLRLGTIHRNPLNPTPHHIVTAQSPLEGRMVNAGSNVNIWVDGAV